jgi:hypothetical protein
MSLLQYFGNYSLHYQAESKNFSIQGSIKETNKKKCLMKPTFPKIHTKISSLIFQLKYAINEHIYLFGSIKSELFNKFKI